MKEDKYNVSDDEMIKQIEEVRDKATEAQVERIEFLGELKERVIVALTKEQVEEKGIYIEVKNALCMPQAKNLVISRGLPFDKIREYIEIAEEQKINFKMVDSLNFKGNIGLVVSSDDVVVVKRKDLLAISDLEKIKKKNLPDIYYESFGKQICDFHYEIIKKEIPELLEKYQKISFFNSIFGVKCPICKKLGGKKHG